MGLNIGLNQQSQRKEKQNVVHAVSPSSSSSQDHQNRTENLKDPLAIDTESSEYANETRAETSEPSSHPSSSSVLASASKESFPPQQHVQQKKGERKLTGKFSCAKFMAKCDSPYKKTC